LYACSSNKKNNINKHGTVYIISFKLHNVFYCAAITIVIYVVSFHISYIICLFIFLVIFSDFKAVIFTVFYSYKMSSYFLKSGVVWRVCIVIIGSMSSRNYKSEWVADVYANCHYKEVERDNGSWYRARVQRPGWTHSGESSKKSAQNYSCAFLYIVFDLKNGAKTEQN
jgi:hypothetical protein